MNTPNLRFKEFIDSWSTKEMKEILSIGSGKDYKHLNKGDIPVYGTGGLMTMVDGYLFDGETVCIGRKGTIDKPLYHKGRIWTVDTLFYTHSFTNVIPYFVYLLFQNVNWKQHNEAGGVPSLTKKTIELIKFNIPKIAEQQKIADFFQNADNRLNLLKNKKTLLEQYKKAVMQKIFSQELRFKDDNGGDYPKWKNDKLKAVTKIYDGTHQTPKYTEHGIPFYSVEHVTANNFSKTKFISEEVFTKENKRVKLEKGDILMTRIGDIGTSRLLDWDVKASFYVSLVLLKPCEDIDSSYLNQFIKTPIFQGELWERTIHVAFPKKINLGEIGECLLHLPCLKEQKKIARFLVSIEDKIKSLQQQVENTEIWKKSLLQQMFV